jgi:hypothetical protein
MHRLQHGGILPANSRAAMFLSAPEFSFCKNGIGGLNESVLNVRAWSGIEK